MDNFIQGAFASLATAVKRANQLDSKELQFHSVLNPEVGVKLEDTKEQARNLLNSLAGSYSSTISSNSTGPLFSDIDDAAIQLSQPSSKNSAHAVSQGPGFKKLSEVTDLILDRLDTNLHFLKTGKNPQDSAPLLPQSAPIVTTYKKPEAVDSSHNTLKKTALEYHLIHAKQIPRPQLKFKDTIDNSNSTNFVWKIKEKPFAQVPLEYSLPGHMLEDSNLNKHLEELGLTKSGASTPLKPSNSSSALKRSSIDADELDLTLSYTEYNTMAPLSHPYEYEIKHYTPPQALLESRPIRKSNDWKSDSNYISVDTTEQLDAMISDIVKLTGQDADIAIDLEHHDYRSFMGFTCLIQLSSRKQDYIIDTLELRDQLHKLNVLTADPSRVKVFHGAESDIVWLQRDFGVYVVGLFDTYHASKVLGYPKHSLQYLLQTIPKVTVDKKYQLADWRIRPLTQEMINYARSDTHYLLEIFDFLCNQVHSSGSQAMNVVINKSKNTSLRVFVKDHYDPVFGEGPNGWSNLIQKQGVMLGQKQMAVFRALHAWRDETARVHDESVRYVLPNYMLFSISTKLPNSVQKLLATCVPTPPLVRIYSKDIVDIISDSLVAVSSNVNNTNSVDNFQQSNLADPRYNSLVDAALIGDLSYNYPVARFPVPLDSAPIKISLSENNNDLQDPLQSKDIKPSNDPENHQTKNSGLCNSHETIDMLLPKSLLFKDKLCGKVYFDNTIFQSVIAEIVQAKNPFAGLGKIFYKEEIKEQQNDENPFESSNIDQESKIIQDDTTAMEKVNEQNQSAVKQVVNSSIANTQQNKSKKRKQLEGTEAQPITIDYPSDIEQEISIKDIRVANNETIILSDMLKTSKKQPNRGKGPAKKRNKSDGPTSNQQTTNTKTQNTSHEASLGGDVIQFSNFENNSAISKLAGVLNGNTAQSSANNNTTESRRGRQASGASRGNSRGRGKNTGRKPSRAKPSGNRSMTFRS
ncbi:hypothetical protein BB561_004662 [Smittium simulii]|uniref:HRDC domain-containing protein n=1 Tax=Smittium simulii TaxID=133385 RepID=A0A2T9YEZ6_9FUNG|nr:hypothetical protein BB561_004662 [Smittium simulii]